MVRKIVKVYLTPQQKKLLEKLCYRLGMGESEALRYAFLDMVRSMNLVTEQIHGTA